MNIREAREIFNLGGHLIKVLLCEEFHSHKVESVALEALKAKGFIEGYAAGVRGPEVRILINALDFYESDRGGGTAREALANYKKLTEDMGKAK